MDLTTQVLRDGLVFGSVLALVACSFNIIHRPTNVLNFAQGDFVMVGAMLAAVTMTVIGLPWLVGLVLVLVGCAAIALVEERIAVTPVLKRSMTSVSWVITTLAFSIIVENIIAKAWGPNPRTVPVPPGLSQQAKSIGGALVSSYDVFVVIVAALILIGLELLDRTPLGSALSAVAEDREIAMLRGINPVRLTQRSFLLSGAIAGLAGVLVAPLVLANTSLAVQFLLPGFAAAAIGGLGSNRGALIGGYTIGLVQAAAAAQFAVAYQSAAVFVVLLGVLLLRPQGIFAPKAVRHV
jgi:branched-chain amino acid transport system permease protein